MYSQIHTTDDKNSLKSRGKKAKPTQCVGCNEMLLLRADARRERQKVILLIAKKGSSGLGVANDEKWVQSDSCVHWSSFALQFFHFALCGLDKFAQRAE
jgi:hypothetical protein